MPTEHLVEPSGQVANEADIKQGLAATVKTKDAGGQSSADALREGMSKMKPAVQESSAAKLASSPDPAPAKEGDKAGDTGTEQSVSPSVLEGFQGGLKQARKAKIKAYQESLKAGDVAQEEVKEEPKEEVKEPVKEEPPVKSEVKPDEETPVTDEEIKATLEDPAISKRHQKRMTYLANSKKELEEKLKALEAKPQTDATEEKIKKLEEDKQAVEKEVIKYRRRYSLENEPEVKKYDEIVAKADDSILSRLKDRGISEQTIKLIKDSGGFDGFSRSHQLFKIQVKDADDQLVEKTITASDLAKQWLNDMDVGDSEYIRAKMKEKFDSIDSKKRVTEELSADAENWFKQQQEQQKKAFDDQVKAIESTAKVYNKWAEDFTNKADWLKDKVPAENATEAEKTEIENYNKHNAGVKALLVVAGRPPKDIAEYISLVEQAATTQKYRRANSILTDENAALKKQLEKVRSGSSTTGKPGGGSISKVPAQKPDNSIASQLKIPVADSLREAMEQLREPREG